MSIPILPLAEWPEGINQASIPANDNANRLGVLNGQVISKAVTAQPAGVEGAIYILPGTHTGAQWSTFDEDDLTIYKGGTWHAFAPIDGVVVNFSGHQEQYLGSSGWTSIGGGSFSNPMTTAQDLIKATTGGAPVRLGVGSNGQVLSVAAGAVGWATPSAGFSNPMTTIGDVIVGDTGGAAIRLANGTAGHLLTAQSGAPPAWVAPSGGGSVAGSDKQIQYNNAGAFGAEAGFEYDPATNTFSAPKAVLSAALNEAKAADIASAGTTDIGAATGNLVHVTGTTTITALGTVQAGTRRIVVFDGALTLTHNATSLILPTGASITTAAGDTAVCVSEGSGNWRVTAYQRKDGTALVVGGASLTNWTEAVSTSAPNATVPAVSFAVTNAATDVDAVLKPKGTGGVLAAIPNNTATGGNKRGQNAVDLQTRRSVNTQVASNTTCVIAGGDSNTASGTYSAVLGGQTNIASGPYSAVGGGQTNTASAFGASIMGGTSNTASTGDYAAVAGGNSNTASGFYAVTTGGLSNVASGDYSRAGGNAGTTRGIRGADVFGAGLTNSQGGRYLVRCSTTDATPKVLTASGAAASAALIIALPNTSVFTFSAVVTAKAAATDGAGWKVEGVVQRGASAATTAFIGTPTVTALGATAGAAAWALACVVDTTNGGFTFQATGAAATNINWTGYVTVAEA